MRSCSLVRDRPALPAPGVSPHGDKDMRQQPGPQGPHVAPGMLSASQLGAPGTYIRAGPALVLGRTTDML